MKEFIFNLSFEGVYKWSIFICHGELIFMFLFNGKWIYEFSNANLKKTLNSQQCFSNNCLIFKDREYVHVWRLPVVQN